MDWVTTVKDMLSLEHFPILSDSMRYMLNTALKKKKKGT